MSTSKVQPIILVDYFHLNYGLHIFLYVYIWLYYVCMHHVCSAAYISLDRLAAFRVPLTQSLIANGFLLNLTTEVPCAVRACLNSFLFSFSSSLLPPFRYRLRLARFAHALFPPLFPPPHHLSSPGSSSGNQEMLGVRVRDTS